jgi:hypothetical protein
MSRLWLDAQSYAFPTSPPSHRRGPRPKKGKRQRPLWCRIDEAQRRGKAVTLPWYGREQKTVRLLSDICLWYTPGELPVPIRWVLVVDPTDLAYAEAFFSTDLDLAPEQIVEWFVLRWNVEVTFEESRRHLGVETQRQWSDRAIARTTPVLLGLFSLVCLMAHHLTAKMQLLPRSTVWYLKTEATFSDVIALVRRALWAEKYYNKSTIQGDQILFHRDDREVLLDQLADTG